MAYFTVVFFSTEDNPIYYNDVTNPDTALRYIKQNYPWYVKAFLYKQKTKKRKGYKPELFYIAYNFPNQVSWMPSKKK